MNFWKLKAGDELCGGKVKEVTDTVNCIKITYETFDGQDEVELVVAKPNADGSPGQIYSKDLEK